MQRLTQAQHQQQQLQEQQQQQLQQQLLQQARSEAQRTVRSAARGRLRRRASFSLQTHTSDGLQSQSSIPEAPGGPGGPGPVLQPPIAVGNTTRHCLRLSLNEGAGGAAANTAEPLQVTVLGAGQDVGRSAVYVRRGERGLLFDCGSHLGAKQARKLPVLNLLLQLTPHQQSGQDVQTVEEALLQPSPLFAKCTDATIVSHFHMDHCGSLPSFTERLGYRNPIAMTFPTRALSPVLLLDSARIFKEATLRGRQQHLQDAAGSSSNAEARGGGSLSQEQWNYTEGEAQRCMRRCSALRLHESWEAAGWTVTPYYAGHVLGAAMFHAQLPGGFSVVYTGDFNTAPDRHLGSASIPRLRPDLLISECTYGSCVRPSKRITEREFCDAVHDALKKGGKVLIPVFAVGRAQELCTLLNSYWQRMQLQYPIYFGGGMTEKANKYYKLYVQWTGSDLAHRLDDANTRRNAYADHIEDDDPAAAEVDLEAFNFSHISALPPDVLTAPTPMVLLATPGMLHGGLALKALKLWADGTENLVLLPGYCVRGTIGAMLIDGQRDIPLDARTRLKISCKIRYMSFSAHADTTGIQQLCRHLQPQSILLVHGEKEGMMKLSRVLQRELGVPVHTPPTGQTVSIPLKQIEQSVPVYIHQECLRHFKTDAADSHLSTLSSKDASCDCDDPALASLIQSPAMQSYLNPPMVDSQSSLSVFSPFFVPPASLFFRISSSTEKPPEEGLSGSISSKGTVKNIQNKNMHLLVDFNSLVRGASDLAVNGCGSLRHFAREASSKRGTSTEPLGAREGEEGQEEDENKCESSITENKREAVLMDSAVSHAANWTDVPPRCLQLVALRYRHELIIKFETFQQLLHLFMEYIVQCRQAYVQQRMQSGLTEDACASAALATPDFCDFGDQLKLQKMEGGGVILEFLSLIAIHDGQEHLSIQWADADERRRGAVSVFVEYFSNMANTPEEAMRFETKPPLACGA